METFPIPKRRLVAALGAAGVVLIAAGCGGSGSSSAEGVASVSGGAGASSTATTTTAVSRDDQLLSFVKCLRKQGLDVKDPQPDANGNLRPAFSGVDQSAMTTAGKACQSELGGGQQAFSQQDQQALQASLVKFAKCMRSHGVADFPDPSIGTGLNPGTIFPGYDQNRLQNDPKVNGAAKACQSAFAGTPIGGQG